MFRRRPIAALTLLLFVAGPPATDRPAAAGVREPGFLEQYAATGRFRLGQPRQITAVPDGSAVLFLRSGPRNRVLDLYEMNLKTGRERVLLTADEILDGAAEKLTAEEKARRERMRQSARGIASFELSRDGKRILVPLSGRLFVIDRSGGAVSELSSNAGSPIDARLSPDGSRVACVRGGEVHVIEIAGGDERRITSGAGGTITNGLAEFVAQEEMSRFHGFWWSPDSKWIVYQQTDTAGLEVMNIMDATHPEREPGAWPYPRPGKKNAAVSLGIVGAGGGPTRWIEWDRDNFEYLAGVHWQAGAPLTILVQNRRQTEQRLLEVDPIRGTTSTLLVEQDEAWVEIDQKMPQWLPDGSGFLWMTERNGALQLELRRRDGGPWREITPLDLGLQEFEHFFPESGEVVVRASVDPTQSHLFRVPLDPAKGPPRRGSVEPGVHDVVTAPGAPVYAVNSKTLTGGQRTEIHDSGGATGKRVRAVSETPTLRPNLEFTTVGSDPAFHAAIVRPDDFENGRKYPVIVHVYGGPTSQMVRAYPGKYLLDQWFADQGYIVVAIDGRGTPGRGRDWNRAVKNNLIEIPLADQAAALTLLGRKYAEMDLARVGIYGWSFGGYFSAMGVMRRPELFRAGVAGAPVVDWRDYDTHYTERYMDLPQTNTAGYDSANVMTYAAELRRPLLLIHGTDDDNVYFTHSLKLADALFREGKTFDFLPLPGFTHMVADPLVTRRLYERILGHFDEHLAAVSGR